jgi:hypothetical protein
MMNKHTLVCCNRKVPRSHGVLLQIGKGQGLDAFWDKPTSCFLILRVQLRGVYFENLG